MSDKKRGLIHVYTGDGKGKTTAAMGVVTAGTGYLAVAAQSRIEEQPVAHERSAAIICNSVRGIHWRSGKAFDPQAAQGIEFGLAPWVRADGPKPLVAPVKKTTLLSNFTLIRFSSPFENGELRARIEPFSR